MTGTTDTSTTAEGASAPTIDSLPTIAPLRDPGKHTSERFDVARIALPLLAYFGLMGMAGFAAGRALRLATPRPRAWH